MSISKLVTELNTIDTEVKKLMEIVNCLKKRRCKIEQSIIECLQIANQPGFVYNGKIYAPTISKTYQKRKKADKEQNIKNILESSGLKPNDEIIKNVFEVFKSNPMPIQKLTTQKT
jgi:hypothetical protein